MAFFPNHTLTLKCPKCNVSLVRCPKPIRGYGIACIECGGAAVSEKELVESGKFKLGVLTEEEISDLIRQIGEIKE